MEIGENPIQRTRSWFSFALIFFIIIYTVIFCIKNEMHHSIAGPIDYYPEAISIAISGLTYNLDGYVGYNKVYETLINSGMMGSFFNNEEILNYAILEARKLNDVSSGGVHTFWVGDFGYVDYVRAAFLLFGYNIEGLLYFYFVLLFTEVVIFWGQFRKDNLATALLIVFLLSHYVAVSAAPNIGLQLLTVHNYRFLSVLGILPVMHILVLVLRRTRMCFKSFILVCFQAFLLLFIFRARNSSGWMVLMLIIVAGAGTLYLVFSLIKNYGSKNTEKSQYIRLIDDKFRTTLWPVLVVLCIILPAKFTEGIYLDTAYFNENSASTAHFPGMVAYCGIAFHPELNKIYGDRESNIEANINEFCKEDGNVSDSWVKGKARKLLCKWRYLAKLRFMATYRQHDQDAYSAAFKWLHDHGESEFYLFSFEPEERVDFASTYDWFKKGRGTDKYYKNEEKIGGMRAFDTKKDYKWREADLILFKVIWDVIKKHPGKLLELELVIKPLSFLYNYLQYYAISCLFGYSSLEILSFLMLSVVALVYSFLLIMRSSFLDMGRFWGALLVLFVFSMIIPLVGYSNPFVISDSALLLTMCIYWCILILFCFFRSFFRRRSI